MDKFTDASSEACVCFIPMRDEPHDGPGWYYWSVEYPDEGSVGSFECRRDAVIHGQLANFHFED